VRPSALPSAIARCLFPRRSLSPVPSPLFLAVTAIVFDFDGTLVQTSIDFGGIRASLREFFARRGLWDERLGQRYILEMIDAACARLHPGDEAAVRAEALGIVRQAELDACRNARPYPGAAEALRILSRRGYRLGIFTRNTRECCELILRRHPLPHSVLLAREDVSNVKPHPEHLSTTLARLNCPPERALVVGDHPMDVETARVVGARAAGVLTTTGIREPFLEAGAIAVLDSVADLPELLPGQPA
jgi:phosphoglycolate phosphatase